MAPIINLTASSNPVHEAFQAKQTLLTSALMPLLILKAGAQKGM